MKYTIELSKEELVAINMLTGIVSGDPESSMRKYTNSLYDKTRKLLKRSYCARHEGVFNPSASIFCPENTLDKFHELVSSSFDEPCVEMTIEQICEAIGKNVKIVR